MQKTEITQSKITELKQIHAELEQVGRTVLEKAIRAGEILTDVKAGLEHGQWLPWLETNMPFTDRTAARYMRVYERREELKFDSVSNLADAYRLLTDAKPEPGVSEADRARVQAILDQILTIRRRLEKARDEKDILFSRMNLDREIRNLNDVAKLIKKGVALLETSAR